MKEETHIEGLEKIQRVETPAFLLTRIKSKIESIKEEVVSPKWIIGSSMALVAVIIINAVIAMNYKGNISSETGLSSDNQEEIYVNESNQLYYE